MSAKRPPECIDLTVRDSSSSDDESVNFESPEISTQARKRSRAQGRNSDSADESLESSGTHNDNLPTHCNDDSSNDDSKCSANKNTQQITLANLSLPPIEDYLVGDSVTIDGIDAQLHNWSSCVNQQIEVLANYLRKRISDQSSSGSNQNQPSDRGNDYSHETHIPHHTKETQYEHQYIDEISLYTKTLKLELCQVLQVQRLHSTQPPDSIAQSTHLQWHRFYNHPQLPVILYSDVPDAGPLGRVYKQVLQIEVIQRCAFVPTDRKEALKQDTTTRPQRIKVYFYDEYAEVMQEIINRVPATKPVVYMELNNVPACCIVPYAQVAANISADNDMSPFCICIGSQSRVLVGADHMRMDDPVLNIHLVWYAKKSSDVEWQISYMSVNNNISGAEHLVSEERYVKAGSVWGEWLEESGHLVNSVAYWEDVLQGQRMADNRRQRTFA
jgi:hypothetical protein